MAPGTAAGEAVRNLFFRTANTLGGVVNANGSQQAQAPGETPLYAFTSTTFTPCGRTGRTGPVSRVVVPALRSASSASRPLSTLT